MNDKLKILLIIVISTLVSISYQKTVQYYAVANYGKIDSSNLVYPDIELGSFLIEQFVVYSDSYTGFSNLLNVIKQSTNFKYLYDSLTQADSYIGNSAIYSSFKNITPNPLDGSFSSPYVAYDIHYVNYYRNDANNMNCYSAQMKIKFFDCVDEASYFFNNHVKVNYSGNIATYLGQGSTSGTISTKNIPNLSDLTSILGFPYTSSATSLTGISNRQRTSISFYYDNTTPNFHFYNGSTTITCSSTNYKNFMTTVNGLSFDDLFTSTTMYDTVNSITCP